MCVSMQQDGLRQFGCSFVLLKPKAEKKHLVFPGVPQKQDKMVESESYETLSDV